MTSGLMRTIFCLGSLALERSMTVMRLETETWGAARPMPCAAYMVSNMSATNLRSLSSNSVTGSPGCWRTGSGYFTMVSSIGVLRARAFPRYLKIPDLLDVAFVVPLQFLSRIAAEFLHDFFGDDEGYHGLGCYPSGGDYADVGAFIAGAGGFAGVEANGFQWAAQGADGFQVAADDNVFAVGDAAFDAAGVVLVASESCGAFRILLAVVDGVVSLGAEGLSGCHSATDLDGFDGLQAHDRPGKQAVKTLIPVGVGADAGGQVVDDDLEDATNGVLGTGDLFDLGLHAGFGVGVDAA